jgi:hypothetical protein
MMNREWRGGSLRRFELTAICDSTTDPVSHRGGGGAPVERHSGSPCRDDLDERDFPLGRPTPT